MDKDERIRELEKVLKRFAWCKNESVEILGRGAWDKDGKPWAENVILHPCGKCDGCMALKALRTALPEREIPVRLLEI